MPLKIIDVSPNRKQFLIRFDYDQLIVSAVKDLPERKFYKKEKDAYWQVPAKYAASVLDFAQSWDFEVSSAAHRLAEGLNRPTPVLIDPVIADQYGQRKLFKHQIDGAWFLVNHPKAILADDMGLGKTTQALVAAACWHLPIVVICPATLKNNWLREAKIVEVPIVAIFSWAKFPSVLTDQSAFARGFVAIFDEAHYAQSGNKSARGQRFLELCEDASVAFLLTGTPMKNGLPINIKPLLKAIEHPIVSSSANYDIRYCNARATRFTRWDTTGAKNLDELHDKIKDRMLRRTKADCLDLPPLIRTMREAEATESVRQEYDRTFALLRSEYMARVNSGQISGNAEALVMLGHLRHAAAMAKISTTCEIANEVHGQGGSVVVFTNFVDVANHIMIGLDAWETNEVALLIGEIPQDERISRVDSFQSGRIKVLVCTYGTGGVGINLHKAQTVVLHDRPWTPADVDQAESRLHRYGQAGASVTSVWVQYGTLDTEIDDMLDAKSERISMVMEGKRKTMRGTESVMDVANRVLTELFTGDGNLI